MLIEPPITLSPCFLATGIDSPVTKDSSIAVSPPVISPSTGTLSPGFNIRISPIFTSEVGITSSFPLRITLACGGTRLKRACNASVVPRLLFISIQWPNKTNVVSIAAAS